MAPKRRNMRKAVSGNVSGTNVGDESAAGAGAGTSGPGPSKRKRTASGTAIVESEHDSGNVSLIGESVDTIKEVINSTDDVESLVLMQQDWLKVKSLIQTRIQDRRAFLASLKTKDELQLSIRQGYKEPQHPLLNEVILKRLATFLTDQQLPVCRLVSTRWNQVMSAHLKKIFWIGLTFDPPNSHDPNCDHQPLKDFLTDVGPDSSLFPFTQFTLLLNKIPPAVNKFFTIYSEHIKRLELRYFPPQRTSSEHEASLLQIAYMHLIQEFLLPAIPNCEYLYLTELTCQVFTNSDPDISLPKKLSLKYLEIEMICRCEHDDNRHFLTSSTFLTKLIMLNQQLESFHVYLDSSRFSEINIRRIVTMILSYANLDRLRNLTLRSENLVQLNWVEDQPPNFQLKYLEVKNVILWPLSTFLEHHANTLQSLIIDVEGNKWDVLRGEFGGQVYSAPRLPNLRYLSVACLEDQEEHLNGIMKPEIFPEVQKLRICSVNENFIHAHGVNRDGNGNNHNDPDSDTDDEQQATNDNQIQVRNLELHIDDQDSPNDHHFLRNTFYGVQHLILTTSQSRFITPLWTTGFPLKSLELRTACEQHDNDSANDEFYIQHLDTLITGFSVNDCERVYQYIQRAFYSPGGFQLDTFNVDHLLDTLCKEKEFPSIRNFSRLQRFVVTCCRKSSRLTEVTLALLLLWCKSLTAISISNCCISQTFVQAIRQQLPAGFLLDIEGVDIGEK